MTVATYRILTGDALEQLRTLPDASVQTCITSPPYFGLRDYGTARWDGGDPSCDHGVRRWEGPKQTQGAQSGHPAQGDRLDRSVCHCGATRVDQQIGMESTPDEYVDRLVEVFQEVRRVLRDDGTVWLNLGDSFSDKQLQGIPWRVAFALQAGEWYLRSDIVWAKDNPMPESVTDRPTRAHEYIFLLSKRARYWYDAAAIREPAKEPHHTRHAPYVLQPPGQTAHTGLHRDKQRGHSRRHAGLNARWDVMTKAEQGATGRNRRDVWTVATHPYAGAHFAVMPEALVEPMVLAGCPPGGTVLDPFAGSGTTLAVANRLGRHALGIELNPAYVDLVHQRVQQAAWVLGEEAPEGTTGGMTDVP